MTSSRARIEVPEERIAEFCRRRHIRWLVVFGSVLRDKVLGQAEALYVGA